MARGNYVEELSLLYYANREGKSYLLQSGVFNFSTKKLSLLKKRKKVKTKHNFESGLFFIERAREGWCESVRKIQSSKNTDFELQKAFPCTQMKLNKE
jgi:hypothetical protein